MNKDCNSSDYSTFNKKYILRPDPAEVERLIDRLIGLIREEEYADSQGFFAKVTRLEEQIVKARAELLKLVGGE
jgi:hypothetical protein